MRAFVVAAEIKVVGPGRIAYFGGRGRARGGLATEGEFHFGAFTAPRAGDQQHLSARCLRRLLRRSTRRWRNARDRREPRSDGVCRSPWHAPANIPRRVWL